MPIKIEKDIPFPHKRTKELTASIVSLNEGESIYISFSEYSKTESSNCIASARLRIMARGLIIKSLHDGKGRRVWCFKNPENNL